MVAVPSQILSVLEMRVTFHLIKSQKSLLSKKRQFDSE